MFKGKRLKRAISLLLIIAVCAGLSIVLAAAGMSADANAHRMWAIDIAESKNTDENSISWVDIIAWEINVAWANKPCR